MGSAVCVVAFKRDSRKPNNTVDHLQPEVADSRDRASDRHSTASDNGRPARISDSGLGNSRGKRNKPQANMADRTSGASGGVDRNLRTVSHGTSYGDSRDGLPDPEFVRESCQSDYLARGLTSGDNRSVKNNRVDGFLATMENNKFRSDVKNDSRREGSQIVPPLHIDDEDELDILDQALTCRWIEVRSKETSHHSSADSQYFSNDGRLDSGSISSFSSWDSRSTTSRLGSLILEDLDALDIRTGSTKQRSTLVRPKAALPSRRLQPEPVH